MADFGFDESSSHGGEESWDRRTLGAGDRGWPLWPWPSASVSCSSPEPPERDSTVAVVVGASVGGFLAVVILVLMVVKCVRRKKEQKLSTDDLKTEEEGKTDGEGHAEDGAK